MAASAFARQERQMQLGAEREEPFAPHQEVH